MPKMRSQPSAATPMAADVALARENVGDHLRDLDCSILCDEIAFETLRAPIATGSDSVAAPP